MLPRDNLYLRFLDIFSTIIDALSDLPLRTTFFRPLSLSPPPSLSHIFSIPLPQIPPACPILMKENERRRKEIRMSIVGRYGMGECLRSFILYMSE